MSTTLTLYHSRGSCSLAVHVALEEAGAVYESIDVDIGHGAQRQPDYLAVNPKGKVPVIAEGSWVLTETTAILAFIARRHPGADLWPADPAEEGRLLEWLATISSAVHPAYSHVARPERYATSQAAKKDVAAKGVENCRQQWAAVDERLAEGPWALGRRYSVADPYLLVFWRFGAGPTLGFDMARSFPRWTDHTRRMLERPAVRRTFEQEDLDLPAL